MRRDLAFEQAEAWHAVSPRYTLGVGRIRRNTERGGLPQANSPPRSRVVSDCDKDGHIARVEAASEGVDVALTQDGMLAAINLIQSEGMQHLERIAEEGYVVYRQQERITAWYDNHKRQIDLDAAKRLCSDHEIGLCDHGGTRSEPFGTIDAWGAELGTGEIHVAHGRPCENAYTVIELAAP